MRYKSHWPFPLSLQREQGLRQWRVEAKGFSGRGTKWGQMHESSKAQKMFRNEEFLSLRVIRKFSRGVKGDKDVEMESNNQRWGKGQREYQIQIPVQCRYPLKLFDSFNILNNWLFWLFWRPPWGWGI